MSISLQKQRGATLLFGLVMLVLLTLLLISAFKISSSNLKAVGNMQFRNAAIAAANVAIENLVGSNFAVAPAADNINVDMNNDGTTDYTVVIATPTCVRATTATDSSLSSGSLPLSMSSASAWNTIWDIDATVTDVVSDASVHIRSGIRVKLTQTQKNASCT